MARADAYRTQTESPVTKYLTWSSDNKCFSYYDKEKKENVNVKLPITFIHLDELSTIKGWHDASSSGIFSNEVRSTKNQELNVRAFKGGELVKGLYQDIKLRIASFGGHYICSLYAFMDGEIVNIALKSSSLMVWSEFAKENRKAFLGTTIQVASFTDGKKGAVKFSTPLFSLGKPISLEQNEKAEAAYDLLKEYIDSRTTSTPTVDAVVPTPAVVEHYDAVMPELTQEENPLPF